MFFQSGSLRGSSVSGVPFRINEKQYQFIAYWQFFDLEKAR